MKKIFFGKVLIASSVIMALSPGVILADDSMSSGNAGTTSTINPPAMPSTPAGTTTPAAPNNGTKPPKKNKKPKKKQNQQQQSNSQQPADPFKQQTDMQDIPDPEDLNSD